MNTIIIPYIFLLLIIQNDFLSTQLKYSRVRTAKAQSEENLKKLFKDKELEYPPKNIFIRAFKSEAILEIWVRNNQSETYEMLKTYNICALSGDLGPKRKRGDLQIPEGCYYISHFNPFSNFYLSLKINYPNKSDRILGFKPSLGGDIFIHGDCVTIGCIPVTDKYIKELYWIAVQAKSNGQTKIPVHVFPFKMTDENFLRMNHTYKDQITLMRFWENLKPIYQFFENNKKLPVITVDQTGKYIIKSQS